MLEPMYDRRSAWIASGDRGSVALLGTDLLPSAATYGDAIRLVLEGSSFVGISNDNLFVCWNIPLSALNPVIGDIAVVAGGLGTGRAVSWLAEGQQLQSMHTNNLKEVEVQAGHQELVVELLSLVWVEVEARVGLRPRLVFSHTIIVKSSLDTP